MAAWRNRFVRIVACFMLEASAAGLCAASPRLVAGQTVGATTGAISGKITDNTGAVLPGVTIVVSGDASHWQQGHADDCHDRGTASTGSRPSRRESTRCCSLSRASGRSGAKASTSALDSPRR